MLNITSIKKEIASDLRNAKVRARTQKAHMAAYSTDIAMARAILGRKLAADAHAYLSCSDLSISCYLTVQSFKNDKALNNILERAVEAELHCFKSEDSFWGETAHRTFRFRLPAGGLLRIETHLEGGDESCQRVQIGTKVVEQPVYEIRCA